MLLGDWEREKGRDRLIEVLGCWLWGRALWEWVLGFAVGCGRWKVGKGRGGRGREDWRRRWRRRGRLGGGRSSFGDCQVWSEVIGGEAKESKGRKR